MGFVNTGGWALGVRHKHVDPGDVDATSLLDAFCPANR
jgi:hypothetical protein